MALHDNAVLEGSLAYWRSLPIRSGIPDIRDVNPHTLPRLILPHLVIVQLHDGAFQTAQARYVGYEVARWHREQPEGMDIAQFAQLADTSYVQFLRQLAEMLVRLRQPLYCESLFTLPKDHTVTTERLVLPFTDGCETVECAMMIQTFSASHEDIAPLRFLPPEAGIGVAHGMVLPVDAASTSAPGERVPGGARRMAFA